ncbi:hypothetical protein Pelo_3935 [Pelomyxa schiedti]|nr:hypothetical protein Pelo_3935 [Pelomyxa schiedti]
MPVRSPAVWVLQFGLCLSAFSCFEAAAATKDRTGDIVRFVDGDVQERDLRGNCDGAVTVDLPYSVHGTLSTSSELHPTSCFANSYYGDYYRFTIETEGTLSITISSIYNCWLEIADSDCACLGSRYCAEPFSEAVTIGSEYVIVVSQFDQTDFGEYDLAIGVFEGQASCARESVTDLPFPIHFSADLRLDSDISYTTPCSILYLSADYYRIVGTGEWISVKVESYFNSEVQLSSSECGCVMEWVGDTIFSQKTTAGEEYFVIVTQVTAEDFGKYNVTINVDSPVSNDDCASALHVDLPYSSSGLIGDLTTPNLAPCTNTDLAAHYFSFIGDGSTAYIKVLAEFSCTVYLYTRLCDCIKFWTADHAYHSASTVLGETYIIGVTGQSSDQKGAYLFGIESQLSLYPNDHVATPAPLSWPIVEDASISSSIPRYESQCRKTALSGRYYYMTATGNSFMIQSYSNFNCYIEVLSGTHQCIKHMPCSDTDVYFDWYYRGTPLVVGILQSTVIDYGSYNLRITEVAYIPTNTKCSQTNPIIIPYVVTNYLPNAWWNSVPTACTESSMANFFSFTGDGSLLDILSIGQNNFTCHVELTESGCGICIHNWTCGETFTYRTQQDTVYVVVVARDGGFESDALWTYLLSVTPVPPEPKWKHIVIILTTAVFPAILISLTATVLIYIYCVVQRVKRQQIVFHKKLEDYSEEKDDEEHSSVSKDKEKDPEEEADKE